MKKKLQFFVMLCSMILIVGLLSACGKKNTDGDVTDSSESSIESTKTSEPEVTPEPTKTSEPISTPEPTATPEPTPEPTSTPEPTPTPAPVDRSEAQALIRKMNTGWILGNTLDAHGAGNSLKSETYWGNPKTTHEMIDAVAEQGFNSIRIPITWAEHMGPAPDYTVDAAWMDRVEEIVKYAVDNDMYVMINTHHEPDFWLVPDKKKEDKVLEQFNALWKQIAERFKDYDEKLVFEGMNEVRTKGSANEWSGGTPEEREVINHLNSAFIDTVRATGGNNEKRLLIISTYGHSAEYKALKELEIPADPYIAVAVHLYTPYHFTYVNDYQNITVWNGSRKGDISGVILTLKTYLLKKEIPTLVTEYGCVNKDNPEEVIKWAEDYLTLMTESGLKCFWWDNGLYTSSGENFGIFNRRTLSWFNKDLADKIIECTKTE